jgi:hypothetical protein
MQPIVSPCKRDFFPAYHNSGRRSLSEVFWIVLHDEEASTARSAASYFRMKNSGGSAHISVDDKECFRSLRNDQIPWGASSAFGANTHGFHIEQAGYARWLPGQWVLHKNTIERAAYKTALHCKLFKIPVEFITHEHLPYKHGITTHAEITKASKRLDPSHAWQYSHTDPGPFWPRRRFMSRVKSYYAEL